MYNYFYVGYTRDKEVNGMPIIVYDILMALSALASGYCFYQAFK
jgi:hypothetical protein